MTILKKERMRNKEEQPKVVLLKFPLQKKGDFIMNRRKFRTVSLITLMFFVLSTAMVVKVYACVHGCTPGFWKNPKHFVHWINYFPGMYVVDAFKVDAINTDRWLSEYDFLKDMTLLEVLQKKGGKGKMYTQRQQAARIFLRQAVATLLNTDHPDIHHYSSISSVIGLVNAVLEYDHDPSVIEDQKNILRRYNELGSPICD